MESRYVSKEFGGKDAIHREKGNADQYFKPVPLKAVEYVSYNRLLTSNTKLPHFSVEIDGLLCRISP